MELPETSGRDFEADSCETKRLPIIVSAGIRAVLVSVGGKRDHQRCRELADQLARTAGCATGHSYNPAGWDKTNGDHARTARISTAHREHPGQCSFLQSG